MIFQYSFGDGYPYRIGPVNGSQFIINTPDNAFHGIDGNLAVPGKLLPG
jgi:hypothetical protein